MLYEKNAKIICGSGLHLPYRMLPFFFKQQVTPKDRESESIQILLTSAPFSVEVDPILIYTCAQCGPSMLVCYSSPLCVITKNIQMVYSIKKGVFF